MKKKVDIMFWRDIGHLSDIYRTLRELKELADKKIFIRHGKTGKGTRYILFERAHRID